jgi:hypothetical protein
VVEQPPCKRQVGGSNPFSGSCRWVQGTGVALASVRIAALMVGLTALLVGFCFNVLRVM